MKKLLTALVYLCMLSPVTVLAQNVGIGTDTPKYVLDVQGRMRVKTGILGNTFTTSGLWLEDYRNGANKIFFGMQDSIRAGLWGEGGLGWNFNFNGNTGNLGLGRIASDYKIELNNVSGNILSMYKGSSYGGAFRATDSSMEVYTKYGNTACIGSPCPPGNLVLLPPLSGLSTYYSGNVGIGTNKPLSKLSVEGTIGTYNSGVLTGTLGPKSNYFLLNAKNGTTSPVVAPTNLVMQYYTGATNTSGNVGIGTPAPEEKLDVSGNIRVSGQVNKEASNGTHGMLPLAFGRIRGDGFLQGSTGNFSVSRVSKGKYQISIPSETFLSADYNHYVVMITPALAGPYMGSAEIKNNGGNKIDVSMYKPAVHWNNYSCSCELLSRITDGQAYDLLDCDFSFLVYKMY